MLQALSDIRRLFGCLAMGAALFLSTGGHLALLQGVAWAAMVRDYARAESVTSAVEKTFDGKHLCPLCKKIAKARTSQEQAPVTMKAEKKAEVFVALRAAILPLPLVGDFSYPPIPCVNAPEHPSAPPVPVPIAA